MYLLPEQLLFFAQFELRSDRGGGEKFTVYALYRRAHTPGFHLGR